MLGATRGLLTMLTVANRLAVLFFVITLVAHAFSLPFATARVAHAALAGHTEELRRALDIMLVIGVATGIAVDTVLRRLRAMIDTVAARRPFAAANVARLRGIAIALLIVQLLDLALAADMAMIDRVARHAVARWTPSVTGWLAVLLLFVLSQVFAHGTRLQDESEATV